MGTWLRAKRISPLSKRAANLSHRPKAEVSEPSFSLGSSRVKIKAGPSCRLLITITIAVFALIIPAVPAIVAVHLMAAMFLSIPPLVHVVVSVLTTVMVLLRDCRFIGCRATTGIQRQHYLTHTEHKNKSDYRTDSSKHKLIPPG